MKYDVSGKSFTDIMNISIKELQSMSRSDVAKVTSRLVKGRYITRIKIC